MRRSGFEVTRVNSNDIYETQKTEADDRVSFKLRRPRPYLRDATRQNLAWLKKTFRGSYAYNKLNFFQRAFSNPVKIAVGGLLSLLLFGAAGEFNLAV